MMPSPAEIEYYVANLLDRCAGCYGKLDNAKTVVMDRVDYTVCEEQVNCGHCGVKVDYYAYGHWEGDNYRMQFEAEHKKAAEIIRKIIGVR